MKNPLLALILVFTLFACSKEEEEYPFDQSPYVEFDELVFYDDDIGQDTLELSFIVWDREGDIGFRDLDVGFPYNQFNVIVDSNNELVTISNDLEPPYYQLPMDILLDSKTWEYNYFIFSEPRSLFSNTDERSGLYSCEEYIIRYDPMTNFSDPIDTLYGQLNNYYKNLNVDFLKTNGRKFDFQEAFNSQSCSLGDFDAKLFDISDVGFFNPVYVDVFDVERRGEYSWKISYYMRSQAWKLAFSNEPLEIQFSITDRELNESNTASSGLVTLEEITD